MSKPPHTHSPTHPPLLQRSELSKLQSKLAAAHGEMVKSRQVPAWLRESYLASHCEDVVVNCTCGTSPESEAACKKRRCRHPKQEGATSNDREVFFWFGHVPARLDNQQPLSLWNYLHVKVIETEDARVKSIDEQIAEARSD